MSKPAIERRFDEANKRLVSHLPSDPSGRPRQPSRDVAATYSMGEFKRQLVVMLDNVNRAPCHLNSKWAGKFGLVRMLLAGLKRLPKAKRRAPRK